MFISDLFRRLDDKSISKGLFALQGFVALLLINVACTLYFAKAIMKGLIAVASLTAAVCGTILIFSIRLSLNNRIRNILTG